MNGKPGAESASDQALIELAERRRQVEMNKALYLARTQFQRKPRFVEGTHVKLGGEDFYRISNYDQIRPFFMTVVSNSDHWMFISSNGALTAGRRDPDLALFPYYTDDKIHDSAEITGPKTILAVRKAGRDYLWEPFSERYRGVYHVTRNLYKSFCGNKLLFEETNEDLDLRFRYGWFNSDRFGFARRAWLRNLGAQALKIRLLDGIQNLMPWGSGSGFQLDKSTLLDAYKRNELVTETGLGQFRLSSIPVDRPEPAEALRVTTAFSMGLESSLKLLSSVQVNCFRSGSVVQQETDVLAERGAYFLQADLRLGRRDTASWWIVADVNQGASAVAKLNAFLRQPRRLERLIERDIGRGTEDLKRLVAGADGIQKTGAALADARHFSNVLFNIMRGGIFNAGYEIDPLDLFSFVQGANKNVAARASHLFRKLTPAIHHREMIARAVATRDPDLERISREYLPLTFSRRHGDPSRPWNRFCIATRDRRGKRVLNYEGNWRDIFQNWEALAFSYPAYAPSMICRFVNASTPDGYNPYRITRAGIDWEVPDPSNPWSHIGYWGDHQVIYLLKLLEITQLHEPGTLREFLTKEIFAYANVPYRIKPYEELLADPKHTVDFDQAVEEVVRGRLKLRGSDGKLVWDGHGRVRLVNLTEKLLVLLLAKFSNFIPEAGIWLNTQRPEWNDANNALVGNGVSMVTLYYLRRFLGFCLDLFAPLEQSRISVSEEVADLFLKVFAILDRHQSKLEEGFKDRDRRLVLDLLGRAGSRYRDKIYRRGLGGQRVRIRGAQIGDFLRVALAYLDQSIRANRRPDGLYHAYNLVRFDSKNEVSIRRLYEMLEGQVAILSSGYLSPKESLDLLRSLRLSALFRRDQHSYLLYPNRRLPGFAERNNIAPKDFTRSRLLRKLIADGNDLLVEKDINRVLHFNGSISNSRDVARILTNLEAAGYAQLIKKERMVILEIFERLFDHQSFTGRSGTFFGYEGLGCIYWHMVSKLLLAAQETVFRAVEANAQPELIHELERCYYDIRAGIGHRKAPAVWGAFPMDPYSHTPGQGGARQPGLTGQVKEDILCRFGELGIIIREGKLHFRPRLLRKEDFLAEAADFRYWDVDGVEHRIQLPRYSLGFTYCQVPIVYRIGSSSGIILYLPDKRLRQDRLCLAAKTSDAIFKRTGEVRRIDVVLGEHIFGLSPRASPI